MAIGPDIEKRSHITGFREEIARAAATSPDAFFTWFDFAEGKDAAFLRGNWDFAHHIAGPLAPFIKKPENLEALEIGHGGGRILAAASRYFRTVHGVDIHDQNERVLAEFAERGVRNAKLMCANGSSIPLADASLDVVYSFIVLQHVERYEIFRRYLEETARVLKPGGLAVIYFGRWYGLSYKRTHAVLRCLDAMLEPLVIPKGWREVPAKVNCTNLVVTRLHARRLARRYGLETLATLTSHRRVPDRCREYGGQNGLVLRKL